MKLFVEFLNEKYMSLSLLIWLSGCAPENPYIQMEKNESKLNDKAYEIMGWLLTANPKIDAYSAFEKGDHKFYAIKLHHRISVPIYEDYCPDWIKNGTREQVINVRSKYLEGAGYGAQAYEHRKLSAIAELYIEEYNSTLWFHLKESGSFECVS